MAMKLRLAAQMPQNLTPEEVELKTKLAEYKAFLVRLAHALPIPGPPFLCLNV